MTNVPDVRSILLVDDDGPLRERLAFALRKRGFLVATAANVEEAIASAIVEVPSRAIVDLRMPGASGLSLIKELRRLHRGIRILILSAYGSISTAVDAMRLGADNFLQKPASVDEILLAFEGALPRENWPNSELPFEVPTLERAEWEHITRVLAECQGNVVRAAKALGLHRRTLQRKLSKTPSLR